MTKVIFSAPQFDLECTASRNWKGLDNYVVRYGLQCTTYETVEDAFAQFTNCVSHALSCE